MREKISTRIPTPEDRKNERMVALFEALGREGSGEDHTEVETAIDTLREEIEKTPRVGRELEKDKVGRNEFVIPLLSREQKDRILETLFDLGIHPWEDQGLLIVDRKSDLKKLELAGIVRNAEYRAEPKEQEVVTLGPDPDEKRFAFPLPQQAPVEHRKREGSPKVEIQELFDMQAEDPGVDTELLDIVRKFDAGILDDDEPEFEHSYGSMPTLKLFPHTYIWDKKKHTHTHARTGEVIGLEQEAELLKRALEGESEATDTLIRLHTGFVVYIAKYIQRRFGGDIDEHFQSGLLGLEYSIRNFDPDREGGSKFTAYAGVCVEGFMRRRMSEDKRKLSNSVPKTNMVNKLRRAEDKREQLVGPGKETEDDRERLSAIARLEQRLLIGAMFDPIEEHLDDDVWLGQEALVEGPTQDEHLDAEILKRRVNELLLVLTPREERVLRLRFGLGEDNQSSEFKTSGPYADGISCYAIGEIMGISHSRVSQIEHKALRKLKHPSRSRKLNGLLARYMRAPEDQPHLIKKIPEDLAPDKTPGPIEEESSTVRIKKGDKFGFRQIWTSPESLVTEFENANRYGKVHESVAELAEPYKQTNPEWFNQEGKLHEDLVDKLKWKIDRANRYPY